MSVPYTPAPGDRVTWGTGIHSYHVDSIHEGLVTLDQPLALPDCPEVWRDHAAPRVQITLEALTGGGLRKVVPDVTLDLTPADLIDLLGIVGQYVSDQWARAGQCASREGWNYTRDQAERAAQLFDKLNAWGRP